jgi:hypothetical protein
MSPKKFDRTVNVRSQIKYKKMPFQLKKSKDAGFVYESLRIETNRVIWDFGLYETNPRNESFKNESTKRIHDTNL